MFTLSTIYHLPLCSSMGSISIYTQQWEQLLQLCDRRKQFYTEVLLTTEVKQGGKASKLQALK